jgi:hypothetical protein
VEAAGHAFVLKVAAATEDRPPGAAPSPSSSTPPPWAWHRRSSTATTVADRSSPTSSPIDRSWPSTAARVTRPPSSCWAPPCAVARAAAPAGAPPLDGRGFLAQFWERLRGFALPAFVVEAVEGLLAEEARPGRAARC